MAHIPKRIRMCFKILRQGTEKALNWPMGTNEGTCLTSMMNLHVAGNGVYTPGYTDDERYHFPRFKVPCCIKNRNGKVDKFTITFIEHHAMGPSPFLCKGAVVDAICKTDSFFGQIYNLDGTVMTDRKGKPYKVPKVSFTALKYEIKRIPLATVRLRYIYTDIRYRIRTGIWALTRGFGLDGY